MLLNIESAHFLCFKWQKVLLLCVMKHRKWSLFVFHNMDSDLDYKKWRIFFRTQKHRGLHPSFSFGHNKKQNTTIDDQIKSNNYKTVPDETSTVRDKERKVNL